MSVFSVPVGQRVLPEALPSSVGDGPLTPRQRWDAAELAAEQMMANIQPATAAPQDQRGGRATVSDMAKRHPRAR